MKVIVCTTSYPTLFGGRAMYYVHSRNLYYKKSGIEVVVLNFSATSDYVIDGINVISLSSFKKNPVAADLLISHAANLRNHYIFIRKYGKLYAKKLFVFHGHEVLYINKYYPKPYYYKDNILKQFFQSVYDKFEIFIWRNYIARNLSDIRLIFVSNWFFGAFCKDFRFNKLDLKDSCIVISNSIGEFFERNSYSPKNIQYDFITIRQYMDDSKYSLDVVLEIARKYSYLNFCVVGKGDFFKYYEKPDNVEFIEAELTHEKMRAYLDKSRIALLPTKEDTQGLLACEFAAYGIPLITSDIEVCLEVLGDCEKVFFISNENPDITQALEKLKHSHNDKKWDKYFAKNTILKEIEYIKEYIRD